MMKLFILCVLFIAANVRGSTTHLLEAIVPPSKRRQRRDNREILNLRDHYPSSPVQAFFGRGATQHLFGMATLDFKISRHIGVDAEMPLKDGSQLNTIVGTLNCFTKGSKRVHFGETIGAVNNYKDFDWNDMYTRYQNALDRQSNGTAKSVEYTPTAFFGQSPFRQDLSTGVGLYPSSGRLDLVVDAPNKNTPSGRLGFRLHERYQPQVFQIGYAQSVNGVDPFRENIDWQDQFTNFLNRRQQEQLAQNPNVG